MNPQKAIGPTDLRDFLKHQGWVLREEGIAHRLFVMEHPQYPRRQLVYPIEDTAVDYAEAVSSVIDKLSGLTDTPRDVLLAQAKAVGDDVLRFRVKFDTHDHDGLPLSFASRLVEVTERLLKSAACTVVRPRTYHPRLSLSEANQLIEKSTFGHTEAGSFVLKVACPVHAMEDQGSLGPEGDRTPFVRQVTLLLQRALAQLVDAIEADNIDTLVGKLKASNAPLISSNFCEALTEMRDDVLDNSMDLSIDWSQLEPVSHCDSQRRVLRLQRDYFPRIEEIRRELRAVAQDSEDTFIGTVEGLDGEMGSDGRRTGGVILALLLPDEGQTVRARTMLGAADYLKADQAHMTNGAYVRVTGRLRPGRQPRQITDISAFEVLAK